jgi:SLIT-ROBO Rho GTPase activating protein
MIFSFLIKSAFFFLSLKGIFRVPGAQLDINQFKEAFEKGEDPLVNITGRDMNSVAGVLKLYFRELKEPLFTRDMFDSFILCIGKRKNNNNKKKESE